MRTKNKFTRECQNKGYTLAEIAELFGVKARQMAYIAKNPRRRDLMSLESLPNKGNK